jgi:thiol-disulfide isomerase/thioredoxin
MKNYKSILTIFIWSLLIGILLAPLRGYTNFMISSLIGFIAYFLLTNYVIYKFKSRLKNFWILLLIFAGLSIIELPSHIYDYHATLISLPDLFIHCLGILIGWLYNKTNRLIGVAITAIAFCFVLYMFFEGYNRWTNKLSFGSFTFIVSEEVPKFILINSNGFDFTNKDLSNKLVIFDFWTTSCGVCFKKFPLVQEKFDKYKNTPDIEFYSVNIPWKRDSIGKAEKIFSKYSYTFPRLNANSDSLAKIFKILVYPTVIIIRNGEEIIYRGNIEGIDEIIEKTKKTIKMTYSKDGQS